MSKKVDRIWIEAEDWAPGVLDPLDDNTDVGVTLSDGSRWVATFFTYTNIESLRKKNQRDGECLSGKYFAATDMILIDEISRKAIQEVVLDLLEKGDFENFFTASGLPAE